MEKSTLGIVFYIDIDNAYLSTGGSYLSLSIDLDDFSE
jgi:hypothetical protein